MLLAPRISCRSSKDLQQPGTDAPGAHSSGPGRMLLLGSLLSGGSLVTWLYLQGTYGRGQGAPAAKVLAAGSALAPSLRPLLPLLAALFVAQQLATHAWAGAQGLSLMPSLVLAFWLGSWWQARAGRQGPGGARAAEGSQEAEKQLARTQAILYELLPARWADAMVQAVPEEVVQKVVAVQGASSSAAAAAAAAAGTGAVASTGLPAMPDLNSPFCKASWVGGGAAGCTPVAFVWPDGHAGWVGSGIIGRVWVVGAASPHPSPAPDPASQPAAPHWFLANPLSSWPLIFACMQDPPGSDLDLFVGRASSFSELRPRLSNAYSGSEAATPISPAHRASSPSLAWDATTAGLFDSRAPSPPPLHASVHALGNSLSFGAGSNLGLHGLLGGGGGGRAAGGKAHGIASGQASGSHSCSQLTGLDALDPLGQLAAARHSHASTGSHASQGSSRDLSRQASAPSRLLGQYISSMLHLPGEHMHPHHHQPPLMLSPWKEEPGASASPSGPSGRATATSVTAVTAVTVTVVGEAVEPDQQGELEPRLGPAGARKHSGREADVEEAEEGWPWQLSCYSTAAGGTTTAWSSRKAATEQAALVEDRSSPQRGLGMMGTHSLFGSSASLQAGMGAAGGSSQDLLGSMPDGADELLATMHGAAHAGLHGHGMHGHAGFYGGSSRHQSWSKYESAEPHPNDEGWWGSREQGQLEVGSCEAAPSSSVPLNGSLGAGTTARVQAPAEAAPRAGADASGCSLGDDRPSLSEGLELLTLRPGWQEEAWCQGCQSQQQVEAGEDLLSSSYRHGQEQQQQHQQGEGVTGEDDGNDDDDDVRRITLSCADVVEVGQGAGVPPVLGCAQPKQEHHPMEQQHQQQLHVPHQDGEKHERGQHGGCLPGGYMAGTDRCDSCSLSVRPATPPAGVPPRGACSSSDDSPGSSNKSSQETAAVALGAHDGEPLGAGASRELGGASQLDPTAPQSTAGGAGGWAGSGSGAGMRVAPGSVPGRQVQVGEPLVTLAPRHSLPHSHSHSYGHSHSHGHVHTSHGHSLSHSHSHGHNGHSQGGEVGVKSSDNLMLLRAHTVAAPTPTYPPTPVAFGAPLSAALPFVPSPRPSLGVLRRAGSSSLPPVSERGGSPTCTDTLPTTGFVLGPGHAAPHTAGQGQGQALGSRSTSGSSSYGIAGGSGSGSAATTADGPTTTTTTASSAGPEDGGHTEERERGSSGSSGHLSGLSVLFRRGSSSLGKSLKETMQGFFGSAMDAAGASLGHGSSQHGSACHAASAGQGRASLHGSRSAREPRQSDHAAGLAAHEEGPLTLLPRTLSCISLGPNLFGAPRAPGLATATAAAAGGAAAVGGGASAAAGPASTAVSIGSYPAAAGPAPAAGGAPSTAIAAASAGAAGTAAGAQHHHHHPGLLGTSPTGSLPFSSGGFSVFDPPSPLCTSPDDRLNSGGGHMARALAASHAATHVHSFSTSCAAARGFVAPPCGCGLEGCAACAEGGGGGAAHGALPTHAGLPVMSLPAVRTRALGAPLSPSSSRPSSRDESSSLMRVDRQAAFTRQHWQAISNGGGLGGVPMGVAHGGHRRTMSMGLPWEAASAATATSAAAATGLGEAAAGAAAPAGAASVHGHLVLSPVSSPTSPTTTTAATAFASPGEVPASSPGPRPLAGLPPPCPSFSPPPAANGPGLMRTQGLGLGSHKFKRCSSEMALSSLGLAGPGPSTRPGSGAAAGEEGVASAGGAAGMGGWLWPTASGGEGGEGGGGGTRPPRLSMPSGRRSFGMGHLGAAVDLLFGGGGGGHGASSAHEGGSSGGGAHGAVAAAGSPGAHSSGQGSHSHSVSQLLRLVQRGHGNGQGSAHPSEGGYSGVSGGGAGTGAAGGVAGSGSSLSLPLPQWQRLSWSSLHRQPSGVPSTGPPSAQSTAPPSPSMVPRTLLAEYRRSVSVMFVVGVREVYV